MTAANLYSDSKEWYLDAYISRLRLGMKGGKEPEAGEENAENSSAEAAAQRRCKVFELSVED
jgi:hypothetical protein